MSVRFIRCIDYSVHCRCAREVKHIDHDRSWRFKADIFKGGHAGVPSFKNISLSMFQAVLQYRQRCCNTA